MGKRIGIVTKEYIEAAALPDYGPGSKYAIISHKEVIATAWGLLGSRGFTVGSELYACNLDARVARGVYHLTNETDPDMGIMFAWVNSYDKSKRFQCSIGAHLTHSGGYWVTGDMGAFSRKHTGTAKAEAIASMEHQITNAGVYWTSLVKEKDQMKEKIVSENDVAAFLGYLLFKVRVLTIEQASIVRSLLINPGDYNADKDSVWALNNILAVALRKSHPRDWMESQIVISKLLKKMFLEPECILPVEGKVFESSDAIPFEDAPAEPPKSDTPSFEL